MASTWDGLNVTNDEITRFKKAFENEEFRKLFSEYANEISDPKNRETYEKEIIELENERGNDTVLIYPDPGYVVKTSSDGQKCFINICTNGKIDVPSSSKDVDEHGKAGLQWSIPHSFTPPRTDIDKTNGNCKVYDCVFHPDTYTMGQSNMEFKKIIENIAIEGIEKQFEVTLDKDSLKYPKLKYKGRLTSVVIRNKKNGSPSSFDDYVKSKIDVPEKNALIEDISSSGCLNHSVGSHGVITPKYRILYRDTVDMLDYVKDATSKNIPREVDIIVELPLLQSSKDVDLSFFEKQLILKCDKPSYFLDLKLAYNVDDENGAAKFDTTGRTLTITVPIVRQADCNVMSGDNFYVADDNFSTTLSKSNVIQNESYLETNDMQEISIINDTSSSCENKDSPFYFDNAIGRDSNVSCVDSLISGHLSFEYINKTSCVDEVEAYPTCICHDDKTVISSEVLLHKPSDSDEQSLQTIDDSTFELPDYEYFQDNKTVTFILQTKRVVKDSLVRHFSLESDVNCEVSYKCVIENDSFTCYSFCVMFDKMYRINLLKCSVDISKKNVVILVYKDKQCYGNWVSFFAGKSVNSLQEKLFTTEEEISKQLYDLQCDTVQDLDLDSSKYLEVTDLNENEVSIDISQKGDKKRSNQTKNIEIIYNKSEDRPQSILKQTSCSYSESSDDYLSSSFNSKDNSISYGGSESDLVGSDEINDSGFRKSVSFSNYIDKAEFKTDQTIVSLHAALRNKKRRQKKREGKMTGKTRQRQNSSESQYSSDFDNEISDSSVTNGECASDNDLVFSDDTTDEKKEEKLTVNSDIKSSQDIVELNELSKPTKKNKKKKKNKKNKKNDQNSYVTKVTSNEPVKENTEKIVNSISKIRLTENENDSDDSENKASNFSNGTHDKKVEKVDTILSWHEPNNPAEKKSTGLQFCNNYMFEMDDNI